MAFEYATFAMRNPAHVTKHWREQWTMRKALLQYRKEHPVCAATGSTSNLQVHHVLPVSIRPELSADPDNLITLSRSAHLAIGHVGNWKNFNPHVRQAAALNLSQKVSTVAYKEPS